MKILGFEETALRARVFARVNRAAMRFFALGFNVRHERIEQKDGAFGEVWGVTFTWICMCGRTENLHFVLPRNVPLRVLPNVYEELERIGATTEKHLRADGFAPDVIADIVARGDAFDLWWASMQTPRRERF